MGDVIPLRGAKVYSDKHQFGLEGDDVRNDNDGERVLQARIHSRLIAKRRTAHLDRLQIAKNLWDILHASELVALGKRPADILMMANKSHAGDSTKRLGLYAIPSGLTHEEAVRRSDQLRKGVHHYVIIARAAADAAGRPSDHFLPQLFSGTSYLEATEILSDQMPSHIVFLSETLQQACEWIARRHDLKTFFEEIAGRSCGYDLLDGGSLHPKGCRGNPFAIHDRRHSYCADGLTLPSLPLYSTTLGPPIKGTLYPQIDPLVRPAEPHSLVEDPFGIVPAFDWQHAVMIPLDWSGPDDAPGLNVVLTLTREIWLTIAPMGVGNRPIPCFDMRTRTEMRSEDGESLDLALQYWNANPRIYLGGGKELLAANFIPESDQDPLDRTFPDYPFKFRAVEHGDSLAVSGCYFYYERVDNLSCAKFLGGEFENLPDLAVSESFQVSAAPVFCRVGTLGCLIENGLLAAADENRLDVLWDRAVASHIETHRAFFEERRRGADTRLLALRNIWNQT